MESGIRKHNLALLMKINHIVALHFVQEMANQSCGWLTGNLELASPRNFRIADHTSVKPQRYNSRQQGFI